MSAIDRFFELFKVKKPIIGMIHLLPLPGSPRYGGNLEGVIERALLDAKALEEGGVDGVLVENFGDKPFRRDRVGPETISSMTLALKSVLESVSLPAGVNVLRSDCISAIAIAAVTGAKFIRCNVFTDTMVTDQGLIMPCAWGALSYRRALGADVKIFADVLCKHAIPLVPIKLEDSAMTAAYRGLADAIIVTGPETGASPKPKDVERVKRAVPEFPVLVGSGLRPENARDLLKYADGAIVGTYFKEGGDIEGRVDVERVRNLMAVIKSMRSD